LEKPYRVQLGDAVHSMLQHLAQGGNMTARRRYCQWRCNRRIVCRWQSAGLFGKEGL